MKVPCDSPSGIVTVFLERPSLASWLSRTICAPPSGAGLLRFITTCEVPPVESPGRNTSSEVKVAGSVVEKELFTKIVEELKAVFPVAAIMLTPPFEIIEIHKMVSIKGRIPGPRKRKGFAMVVLLHL